jgi:energy-coupling factor transport system ATP-binding protein
MEEAGINCPRVLTLTGKLEKENLLPADCTGEGRICLNANEAAQIVKKAIGTKALHTEVAEPVEALESSDTVLSFQNVSFSYNETANVKNLNVNIHKGDFTAIIGSNGAGKSTFSKLCNGLLKPSAGDVLVLDKNTKKEKVSNLAKHIGFLFQNPDRQICCGTVREEIAFSLRNNKVPEAEIKTRVENTIKEFGFNPDTEPFNMSRGQRQRLCLACLIALNPEILILDEPTTGLDYRECMEVMEKIRQLNQKGTSVFMVCHDMEVVLDFAKTIIVMNRGQIMGQGPARQVLGNDELLNKARLLPPQIAQVAKLLGPRFEGIFTDDELFARIKEAL